MLLMLGGCGGAGSGAAIANWPAKNACAALDKIAVEAAVGQPITSVVPADASETSNATISNCSWMFAHGTGLGGGGVGLLLRTSKSDDYSKSAVDQARTGGGITGPSEDVPGLGRVALWQNDLRSLQVFVDDRRYFALSVTSPPPGLDAKAAAIALAHKII